MQDLTRPYPEWLVEGFAEFMSAAQFNADGSVEIGRQPTYRYAGLLYGDQLPLETLLAGHLDKLTAEQMESVYDRGWLLTHYLTFEPSRKGQLDAYIAAIGNGVDPLQAARQSFGDLTQLQHDLDGYFGRSKLLALHIPAKDLKKVTVDITKLTPGAAAVLPVLMHLRSGADEKYDELASQAAKIEQQFGGDPLVETTLSEAELDAKNYKAAETAADRALAADPQSTDAMILEGRATVKELASSKGSPADFDDARMWFLKANKIDPEDPEPLYRFYESFIEQGRAQTRNAIDALHYASDLAPQDLGVRIQSGEQYLADGDLKDARAALVPVAYDPHGEDLTKRARAMIEKIDAGDIKAALAAAAAASDEKSKSN
jgi:tetratricopeptide (TPR) repeat protein